MTLFGTITKTLFFSEENGAIIFLLKVAKVGSAPQDLTGKTVKVKGKFAVNFVNMPLVVSGDWQGSEYGDTIDATEIHECSLGIREAKKYLAEIGKGVKEYVLEVISKKTRGKVFHYINNQEVIDSILEEVKGDEDEALKVLGMIREHKERIALFQYTALHGANLAASNKLYDTFPDNTLENLLKNPYEMVQKAKIPVRIGDSIALERGIEPMCKERIMTLVEHAMTIRENGGDVCVDLQSLFQTVDKLSEKAPISRPDLAASLDSIPGIDRDSKYNVFYKHYLWQDETEMANSIRILQEGAKEIPWHPEYIDQIEKENGVAFGKQQRMAFSLLKSTGIKILTGGPGTGKTTTVNGLLKYLEMVTGTAPELPDLKKMALSAPSGRASQRMAEATSRTASTCHRMIEFAPYGGTEVFLDRYKPLDANVVVIDETSMLDISLARRVLGACKKGSLVLFVGDINQLQSVGPGAVLQDMIRSQCVQVVQLTDVYRQKGGSPIPVNAKKIIEGRQNLEPANDFQMIKVDAGKAVEAATELTKNLLHNLGGSNDIQILAPAKRGDGGTYELNKALQPILNYREDAGIKFGRKQFHENDRVIMLSNNYQVGYFNGDVGHIRNLTKQSMDIELATETIKIERKDFDDVELAYACTIHKSQGSEYPYCIIVIPADKDFMMDQSVLYTAVTRAKKGVYIIYEGDALAASIKKRRQGCRKGYLQKRIESVLPKVKLA